MEKTYIKNLSLISLIMILIHLVGLTYQIIIKASTFAIILKLLYIAMFGVFLFTLIKRAKITYLIGIIISCIIIIISGIYMDFLSIIIAILVIFYSYNLKGCNIEAFAEKNINKRKTKIERKRNK